MNGLAEVLAAPCYLKYNPVEAENLYQKSANLILMETKSHPFLASSKIGQANLLARQGEYKSAKILYLEAIAILGTLFGKQHPNLVKPKFALDVVYLHCENLRSGYCV
jgi:hypothetical protein